MNSGTLGAIAQPVRSIESFQKAVARLARPPHTHCVLYRGQREPHELLPSLFRQFRHDVNAIHDREADILQRLKNRLPKRTPLRPTNDWDWLSFAQHYRLPTRMLDWTADSLIALFFAVENGGAAPVVYAYHAQKGQIVRGKTESVAPWNIDKTRIMKPAVHSVRVELQQGWHTVHRLHPRKSGVGSKTIPLDDLKWHQGRLASLPIDPSCSANIRAELQRAGIYRATVYGDFDRMCRTIARECGMV